MAARKTLFPTSPRLNARALQKRRKQRIIDEQPEEDDDMASGISYVDAQLTDAQIKALPSTPFVVAPAPGVGLAIMFHHGYLLADTTGGAYGGFGTNAYLHLSIAGNPVASLIAEDIGAFGQLTNFLGALSPRVAVLGPTIAMPSLESYNLAGLLTSAATIEDQPLRLHFQSDEGTALTGGHASNSLSVRVFYSLVPAVAFGA